MREGKIERESERERERKVLKYPIKKRMMGALI
jgi:hypothetical protein